MTLAWIAYVVVGGVALPGVYRVLLRLMQPDDDDDPIEWLAAFIAILLATMWPLLFVTAFVKNRLGRRRSSDPDRAA